MIWSNIVTGAERGLSSKKGGKMRNVILLVPA